MLRTHIRTHRGRHIRTQVRTNGPGDLCWPGGPLQNTFYSKRTHSIVRENITGLELLVGLETLCAHEVVVVPLLSRFAFCYLSLG